MGLIDLLIVLILVGVVLYVINRVIPMDANIKLIINAVVIIVVLLYVLRVFGLFAALNIPVGR